MARQWRIEFPGAMYHVMSRGNSGQNIFQSDLDRHLFLNLLEELTERYNLHVHAYMLMGNHYHLLLKTKEANLSKAMQWFGTTYTRKFNINNHLSGHLFQGRFKCIIVENDAYLLRLSCYIHRNPLRAGIVERLADYPWSSYRFYAYRKKAPDWLTTKPILSQLSSVDPIKAYRIKVQQYSDERNSIWEDVKHGLIYGSQDFVADLKSRFLGDKKNDELPQHNRLLRTTDPQLLINEASDLLDFDLATARNAGKIAPGEKEKRDILIYLMRNTCGLSNREIGTLLGITYSTVSKVVTDFRDRIRNEKDLRVKIDKLNCRVDRGLSLALG